MGIVDSCGGRYRHFSHYISGCFIERMVVYRSREIAKAMVDATLLFQEQLKYQHTCTSLVHLTVSTGEVGQRLLLNIGDVIMLEGVNSL